MSFQGKVIVISGGARGIGQACARAFAGEGASVVIADIEETAGEETAESLRMAGQQAQFIACNVAERLDVRNLIARTLDAHGRLDTLINNAGVMDDAPFLELGDEEFDRIVQVNVKGAFMLGQAAARQLLAQTQAGEAPGSIVNISSVNDSFALPDHVAYSVSKGALSQLSRAMAIALAPHGIRVNAVAPGSIMTRMLENVVDNPDSARRALSRTPLGRFGEPMEIARIAMFLASDAASYITGETIYADGGRRPLNLTVDIPSTPVPRG